MQTTCEEALCKENQKMQFLLKRRDVLSSTCRPGCARCPALSLIFLSRNQKFLKNRPSCTFFQKNAAENPCVSGFRGRFRAPRSADQRYSSPKITMIDPKHPLPPLLKAIRKQPQLRRRSQFLKNRPSFTFFQKSRKALRQFDKCPSRKIAPEKSPQQLTLVYSAPRW